MVGEIESIVHRKLLEERSFYCLVQSDEFKELHAAADQATKDKLRDWVANGNYDLVRSWIDCQQQGDFNRYTVRELRSLASRLMIPDYHIKLKAQLVAEIEYELRPTPQGIGGEVVSFTR